MTTRDPDALLCERCGYAIGQIDPTAECPECGTPIHESAPEHRQGSPWQQADSPTAEHAAVTALALLHKPLSFWDDVVPATRRMNKLFSEMFVLAAAIIVATAAAMLLLSFLASLSGNDRFGSSLARTAGFGAVWGLIAAIVGLITCRALASIEMRGLRFIGARHNWRITPDIARVVCCHASVGWALGLVGAWLGYAITGAAQALARGGGNIEVATFWEGAGRVVSIASIVFGLLLFETLSYLGSRRMKYANRAPRWRDRAQETGGSEDDRR